MTLTAEQIREWMSFVRMATQIAIPPEQKDKWNARFDEIEDAALAGLAVQPRPIEEAPKDGTPIFTDCTFDGKHLSMLFLDVDEFTGWVWDDEVAADADPECAQPEWFILQSSLSSLPQPKE